MVRFSQYVPSLSTLLLKEPMANERQLRFSRVFGGNYKEWGVVLPVVTCCALCFQYCVCVDDCSSSTCMCGQLSMRCWYDKVRKHVCCTCADVVSSVRVSLWTWFLILRCPSDFRTVEVSCLGKRSGGSVRLKVRGYSKQMVGLRCSFPES